MTQAAAMLLSMAVEAAVAAGLAARLGWLAPARAAAIAALATMMSHPVAWAAMVWGYDFYSALLVTSVVELAVATFEAVFYRYGGPAPWSRATMFSVVANGASLGLGLMLEAAGLSG